ncbi:acyl-CoA N-acyltransferase [Cunninghamella echinulata]|nr:acyl-CoA N-acyltransferase [Cunninghamella echinulata]
MEIKIRQETEQDINNVYEINEKAFKQKEEADLVNKLRSSPNFIKELSLVAEIHDDNKLMITVGYLLFTKIPNIGIKPLNSNKDDDGDENMKCLALAPLSVLPNYQKKGIGKALIYEGLKKAKELGYRSVIVLGHEHYYEKFGFLPASQWSIECPFPLSNPNVFRCLELTYGALDHVSGVVDYSKEFY